MNKFAKMALGALMLAGVGTATQRRREHTRRSAGVGRLQLRLSGLLRRLLWLRRYYDPYYDRPYYRPYYRLYFAAPISGPPRGYYGRPYGYYRGGYYGRGYGYTADIAEAIAVTGAKRV